MVFGRTGRQLSAELGLADMAVGGEVTVSVPMCPVPPWCGTGGCRRPGAPRRRSPGRGGSASSSTAPIARVRVRRFAALRLALAQREPATVTPRRGGGPATRGKRAVPLNSLALRPMEPLVRKLHLPAEGVHVLLYSISKGAIAGVVAASLATSRRCGVDDRQRRRWQGRQDGHRRHEGGGRVRPEGGRFSRHRSGRRSGPWPRRPGRDQPAQTARSVRAAPVEGLRWASACRRCRCRP